MKKAVPKKGAVAGKTSATAGKTTPKTTGKGVATKRATRRTAPAMARQSRQQTPAPERYREIQQALTDKGYLKSEPTGVWTTESADALKQFQTENNLSPTGKLSAASLISLGLGPKKNTEPIVPPAVPANPTPVRP